MALAYVLVGALLSQVTYGAVFLTDHANRKIVELRDRTEPCLVYTDQNTVQNMLRNSGGRYLQRMSPKELDDLSHSCSDMDQISKRGGFIYPGTRWCGPGNTASSYSDLGTLTEEDKCCRDHDHCPNQLEPGQCRQGICNISPFTRSHCDCDNAFKRCLREVNSDAANTIGTLYFNVAQVTCFKDRRLCPQYMKEDPSYTWFCEEWKFEPTGDFEASLLTHHLSSSTNRKPLPDLPANLNTESPPSSSIDKNLRNLFDHEPNVAKVMKNSDNDKSNPPSSPHKSTATINTISDGKLIFRD